MTTIEAQTIHLPTIEMFMNYLKSLNYEKEQRISKFFDIAQLIHQGQKRNDGSDFTQNHILPVAYFTLESIAKQNENSEHLDAIVIASLLHDSIEDEPLRTLSVLIKVFESQYLDPFSDFNLLSLDLNDLDENHIKTGAHEILKTESGTIEECCFLLMDKILGQKITSNIVKALTKPKINPKFTEIDKAKKERDKQYAKQLNHIRIISLTESQNDINIISLREICIQIKIIDMYSNCLSDLGKNTDKGKKIKFAQKVQNMIELIGILESYGYAFFSDLNNLINTTLASAD